MGTDEMMRLRWLRKLFGICAHDRTVMRRRDGIMGFWCMDCFRWWPGPTEEHNRQSAREGWSSQITHAKEKNTDGISS